MTRVKKAFASTVCGIALLVTGAYGIFGANSSLVGAAGLLMAIGCLVVLLTTESRVSNPAERSARWPNGYDVLVFCGSVVMFMIVGGFAFDALSDLFGLAKVPTKQTLFQYGGTAVLIWLLLVGTVSFLVGGFVVRRMNRMPARWLSGAVGASYAFTFTVLAILTPVGPGAGSGAGRFLFAFLFFFPSVGLILGALKLKRSNLPNLI